jgi:ketol-acid reductoisomerase
MTAIFYERDADLAVLAGQTIAVVGYGNQGRSWALNLRDSGCDPMVCVRKDATRDQAEADGFAAADAGLVAPRMLGLSGEVERTYRLLREVGYAVQSEFHSPTSQYGQLTRRGRYDHVDFLTTMRALADDIESGRFADEWDGERDAGYPNLTRLKEQHAGAAVREFEGDLRRKLGPGAG